MKELFSWPVTFALSTLLLGLVLCLAVWADLALILHRPPRPRILKAVPLVLVVLAACVGAWAKHCSGLGQSVDAYDLDMLAWLLAGAAAWLFLLRAALARFATA